MVRLLRFAHRAAFLIPHREKAARGGEDGFFLADDGGAIGVADGVGGWASSGVNPAFFTWDLMRNARRHAEGTAGLGALELLTRAYRDTVATKLPGSCTAAVATLVAGRGGTTDLSLAHVGDCGVVVVRDGAVVHRTKEQQYSFNFPVQLGQETAPSAGVSHTVADVRPWDIVLLGSDGVFDNVYDDALLKALAAAPRMPGCPQALDTTAAAKTIAEMARDNGRRSRGTSPFGEAAKRYGYSFSGGKEDDVVVVVGQLSDAATVAPAVAAVAEEFLQQAGCSVPTAPASPGRSKL